MLAKTGDPHNLLMIKAVIFDCFGVLYVDPGLHFYDHMVPNHEDVYDRLLVADRQFDTGLLSIKQHDEMVAELTAVSLDVVTRNLRERSKRHDKLIDFIAELRKSYRVGMLSNIGYGGIDVFFSEEERTLLFDAVVLSSDIGVTKPHQEAFQEIARRLGVEPDECVMIDDREDNCRGAEAAGMQAILYKNFTQTKRVLQAILG